nr:hypothetical protein [Tanacetum cinerariifolium]GEV71033.1 hypothetical protein [Tanacetum cinerariifolium]
MCLGWATQTLLWKNTSGSRKKKLKKQEVFNWETAKYGKICYDKDGFDLRFVETEFLAIVFNDNMTSIETPSCEPTAKVSFLYFVKSRELVSKNGYSVLDIALPPRDQIHIWLCYQEDEYTEEIVHDLEQRLETIFVGRIRDEMRLDVAGTLCFQLGGDRRSVTWRQFILALGLHTIKEMVEDGFEAYWLGSERVIPDKGYLSDYWVEISFGRDFLRGAPSYNYIIDPVRRLCHRLISYIIFGKGQAPKKVTATDLFYLHSMDQGEVVPYLLEQYLFRHAERRNSGARLSGGHFIGRLAHHLGLVSNDGLRGLSVMTRKIPLIDMGRLEEEMQGLRQDVRSLRGLVERSIRFSTWMIGCMTHLMDSRGQSYQAFDRTFWGSSPAIFKRRIR